MKKKDSLYLRTLSTRLKKKRDQGYAGDFDGHWEFSDTIREVREDSPSWHRWASNWSLSRVKIRRRHKRNVQRNLMKKFGVAFHAFEEALAGAEFVNHSMRNSWHLWANEAPEEETGRDLLGTVPDSIGGKHVKLLLLTAMHAHILILGEEILTLLRNGYRDGAAARTRTLYETVMKAGVIAGDQSSTGYDLAERFYISTFIEKYGKKWLTADLTGQEKIIRDSALHAWGNHSSLTRTIGRHPPREIRIKNVLRSVTSKTPCTQNPLNISISNAITPSTRGQLEQLKLHISIATICLIRAAKSSRLR